jgi:hypothetical protein
VTTPVIDSPSRTTRRPARKTGWLVYTALLTAFVILGEARNIAQAGLPTAVTLANWVLTATLLTATWCYGLQKPVGAAWYWRAAFWIVSLATMVMLVPVAQAGPEAIVFTAILLALVLPAYVAAFLYAHRSPQLWRASGENRA